LVSPEKTLIIEQISYAEEALKRLKKELHTLFKDIEIEYEQVLGELNHLEKSETVCTEETFEHINQTLQNTWTKTVSTRNRLHDLDKNLHEINKIIPGCIMKLKSKVES